MKNFLALLAWISAVPTAAFAANTHADPSDRSMQWIDRPWEVRYVLFVRDDGMMKAGVRRGKTKPDKPDDQQIYRWGPSLFEPHATYSVRGADPVSTFLMIFDQTGRIKEPDRLRTLTAKRNVLGDLVLIEDDFPAARPYYFAEWSQGVPGDVSFSPAICAWDDSDRYTDDWNTKSLSGNFGCREWTAQLYRKEQSYIDVTTYRRDGNFIGEFVGWSRFRDAPKPVIGQHGKTWLCLHECPAGEKPGAIRNIKAWAAKHGYPVPKRAPKQPLYPNRDYDFND